MIRRSGGRLMTAMLAGLLLLAALVVVAPGGLAAFDGSPPLCAEGGEGAHRQASDRDTAGGLQATCCTGVQCTAAQGGVLPAAATLPDAAGRSVRPASGGMSLSGTEPDPGRRPPRPIG